MSKAKAKSNWKICEFIWYRSSVLSCEHLAGWRDYLYKVLVCWWALFRGHAQTERVVWACLGSIETMMILYHHRFKLVQIEFFWQLSLWPMARR